MKSLSLRVVFALGLSVPLLPVAHVTTSSALAQSAPASAITAPVQQVYAALEQVQASHADFAQRSKIVATAVDQAYDLEAVLKASIGLRYNALSAEEKQKLLSVFRDFTVARYVSSFKPDSGARFTVTPTVTDSPIGGSKIVQTHIGSADSMPGTEVSYIMTNENGAWKITDVLLGDSHISQAAAQRSDFSATLASGGVPALISVLERKVQNYSKD